MVNKLQQEKLATEEAIDSYLKLHDLLSEKAEALDWVEQLLGENES